MFSGKNRTTFLRTTERTMDNKKRIAELERLVAEMEAVMRAIVASAVLAPHRNVYCYHMLTEDIDALTDFLDGMKK